MNLPVFQAAEAGGPKFTYTCFCFLPAALTSWFKNALSAPQSIVVYRDGVGDGQLQALLDHELPQLVRYLKHACRHR
jgi:hypothetical protein